MTVMEHAQAATIDLTKHGLHNVKRLFATQVTKCCSKKKLAPTYKVMKKAW